MAQALMQYLTGEPRDLTREDMALELVPARVDNAPKRLRETHHRIARLRAAGLRNFEIAERTGFSAHRIGQLLNSPAMIELVAHYTETVDASFEREIDQFHRAAVRNLQVTEDLITDKLDAAVDDGIDIPLRDLIALSADRADRFGYPKQTQSTNVNVNWADLLDKRLNAVRSEKRDAKD